MERKLLAVVAADMVGFSRLVENDETSILSRQKEYFNEIIKPQKIIANELTGIISPRKSTICLLGWKK